MFEFGFLNSFSKINLIYTNFKLVNYLSFHNSLKLIWNEFRDFYFIIKNIITLFIIF